MNNPLHLNVDTGEIHSYEDYQKVWAKFPEVKVTVIRQDGGCKHEIGDSFTYKNHIDRPNGICSSAHHVFHLYLWRTAVGFPCCPPWGPEDKSVYHVHCPAPNGTVWELKRKEPCNQQNVGDDFGKAADGPTGTPLR